MKKLNVVIDFFCMGLALLLCAYAVVDEKNYKLLVLSAVLFCVGNMIYALPKFKERSYFFFFHLTFFFFLLGRPLITVLQGENLEKICA